LKDVCAEGTEDCAEGDTDATGQGRAYGVLPPIEDAADVYNATAVFKRSVAYRMSKAKHSDFARKGLGAQASHVQRCAEKALAPPSVPASDHAAALQCVGVHPTVTELGLVPYATPLSCVGAGGCSGGLVSKSTIFPVGGVI